MNCFGAVVSQSDWTLGVVLELSLQVPVRLYHDLGPFVEGS